MYEPFYNLSADAFRLTPDARFCFAHASHTQAHAYLQYALKLGEGFILVTGLPGTGKTTLIDAFINQLERRNVIVESIAASDLEATELLRTVAYAYGIEAEDLDKAMLRRRIQQFFVQHLQSGRRGLLVIDEAQGLSHAAIEELRLLSDLHSGASPLLQLFLVGQESLRDVMRSPDIEQFQQRVVGTCRLEPLDLRDTRGYVRHRLLCAGWKGDPQFTGDAIVAIYRHSLGVPRHINKLCTRLLLQGYMEGKHEFAEADVLAIAAELHDEQLGPLASNQVAFRDAPQPVPELEGGSLSLEQLALRADSEASARRVASGHAVRESVRQPNARRAAPPPPPPAGHTRDAAPAAPAPHRPRTQAARGAPGHSVDTPWNWYDKRPWQVTLAAKSGPLIILALSIVATRTWVANDTSDRDAEFAAYSYSEMPANLATPNLGAGQQNPTLPVTESRPRAAGTAPDSGDKELETREAIAVAVAQQPVPQALPIETPVTESPRVVTPDTATAAQATATQPREPVAENIHVALAPGADPARPQTIAAPKPHAAITEPASPAAGLASQKAMEPATAGQAAEQAPPSQPPAADADALSATLLAQQTIDGLLSRGEQALDENRLLIPANDNAHNHFREVLTLDPGNAIARDGIDKIVRRYALFAERALDRHDEAKARLYIKRGLRVQPDDKRILALQGRLNTWLARLEEEARQNMPVPAPPPLPAEPPPPQPQANDFIARLKAFFSPDQHTDQHTDQRTDQRNGAQQQRPGVIIEDRGQPVPQ